jgi:hypothetical protein
LQLYCCSAAAAGIAGLAFDEAHSRPFLQCSGGCC